MSYDSDDDSQENEEFSTEKDFEGGEWIDGEFYYKKQRKGRTQTHDERIYGIFAEDAGDSDTGDSDNGGPSQRRGRGNQRKGTSSRKRARVDDKPMVFVTQSAGTSKDVPNEPSESVPSGSNEDEESSHAEFSKMIGNIGKPSASESKSNQEFSDLIQNSDSMKSRKEVQPAPISVAGMGSWEKHTKGIGMKLLQKFGFKGRLGAREDGVSQAIEVVVRPNGQGLGFGEFTEQSALLVNKKVEAEWRGKEFNEEEYLASVTETKGTEGKGRKGQSKSKKIMSEAVAESKSWKKGKKDKQSVRVLSVTDFLEKQYEEGESGRGRGKGDAKQVVIDMRGQHARVITDLSEITEEPSEEEIQKPKLGQELLYNVNLVVELVEGEVTNDSRKLSQDTKRLQAITADIDMLEKQVARSVPRLNRLKGVLAILDRVQQKISAETTGGDAAGTADDEERETDRSGSTQRQRQTQKADGQITMTAVVSLFQTIHKSYPEEFRMFGIISLLPSIISPVLRRTLGEWLPLSNPLVLAEVYSAAAVLSDYFEAEDEKALASEASALMHQAVERLTLPAIRRAVTNDWDVRQPANCVMLYEVLSKACNESQVQELLDMTVLPKLTEAVKSWSPTSDPVPIHSWLHPWLPLLRSKLSVLYPDIRRKLHQALSSWEATDESALAVLRPWRDVFDKTSMDNLLVRSIVPKLVTALRALTINPQNQDIALFNSVLAWHGVVPHIHMVSLFLGEFFPRWLRVLVGWLGVSPDFAEVTQWYLGWKGQFPPALVEDAEIVRVFDTALNIMNVALTAEDEEGEEALRQAGAEIPDTSYFQVIERKMAEVKMKDRLRELNRDTRYAAETDGDESNTARATSAASKPVADVSFRDVVETFAANAGVVFVPKSGRVHAGKQIWQFGKCLCYIDQDVVFAQIQPQTQKQTQTQTQTSSQDWRPIALEELLKLAV